MSIEDIGLYDLPEDDTSWGDLDGEEDTSWVSDLICQEMAEIREQDYLSARLG